ncbi:MAG TPA: MBL fold metallo-hydrolase [Solirubrobacterales bacterium]|nr:MBL fold metallo-hydrolase [Solirubrobacterales bacterium]
MGYPTIEPPATVDLLIVTHEHRDHKAVDAIGGEPVLLRSLAGTHESPLGKVVAIASEHDGVAGTERGQKTIVVFELDGIRIARFGDFGQPAVRPEQRAHLDGIDLLLVPVGGGPTINGATAAGIATELGAAWVVPMHHRTERINFLEPVDDFLAAMPRAVRLDSNAFDTADLKRARSPRRLCPPRPERGRGPKRDRARDAAISEAARAG